MLYKWLNNFQEADSKEVKEELPMVPTLIKDHEMQGTRWETCKPRGAVVGQAQLIARDLVASGFCLL